MPTRGTRPVSRRLARLRPAILSLSPTGRSKGLPGYSRGERPNDARWLPGGAGAVKTMVSGLRIGVDGGCWLNRRGYGRYVRSLLSALARRDDGDRYILFLDRETAAAADLPASFERVV